MAQYRVFVREVWVQEYIVEAEDEEDAADKVYYQDPDVVHATGDLKYDYTPEDSVAKVEKV